MCTLSLNKLDVALFVYMKGYHRVCNRESKSVAGVFVFFCCVPVTKFCAVFEVTCNLVFFFSPLNDVHSLLSTGTISSANLFQICGKSESRLSCSFCVVEFH